MITDGRSNHVTNLSGKRVLLFTSFLFNYHYMIKEQIEKEGAVVHLYDERNHPSSIEKIMIRKMKVLMSHRTENYYKAIIDIEMNFNPDFVLFVSPEAITAKALRMLRKAYPNSVFILYMWDSIKNKGIKKLVALFDKKYSFDPQDCKTYDMIFRPLFYGNSFEKNDDKKRFNYDLSFIGTVHSDRARILLQIKEYCDKNNLSYYFYLFVPGKPLAVLRWIFTPEFRKWEKSYIHTSPLSKNEVAKISSETRCVIDINHPNQTGLTMRTIEMVGLNQKLMTTNKNITEYDFYRPVNQIVISRDCVNVDIQDIKSSYISIERSIYTKYSLKQWVRDIFMVEGNQL
ncbi:hypothetical protein [Faecalibaculum rodentium]|uniref:Lipopolysaccharide biosynthesis protein n=1 Tax=Faecalibaculum rodentium TaxID=1702221 RepID=A0A1Q9YHV5_9FIRM|nr:hypothetical protein [Faecalibaculum rodentium]OLU43724.1 hypothetical protein BO223_10900 [Faecalibaculum rodentium]